MDMRSKKGWDFARLSVLKLRFSAVYFKIEQLRIAIQTLMVEHVNNFPMHIVCRRSTDFVYTKKVVTCSSTIAHVSCILVLRYLYSYKIPGSGAL